MTVRYVSRIRVVVPSYVFGKPQKEESVLPDYHLTIAARNVGVNLSGYQPEMIHTGVPKGVDPWRLGMIHFQFHHFTVTTGHTMYR